MKRKKNKGIGLFFIIFIILILLIGGAALVFLRQEAVYTPVMCDGYKFTCCIEKQEYTTYKTVTDEIYFDCPFTATKCEILSSSYESNSFTYMIGSGLCELYDSPVPLIGNWYKCSIEKEGAIKMEPGDRLYMRERGPLIVGRNTQGSFQIQMYESVLYYCGDSGCTVGVAKAADNCRFSPIGGTIYTDYNLKNKQTGISTKDVPLDSCILARDGSQYVCGYKELTCDKDSDCTGHKYGRFECSNLILQEYGCKEFGTAIISHDVGPDATNVPKLSEYMWGKRCGVISEKSVTCCTNDECIGELEFCDTNPASSTAWTCIKGKECTADYMCGTRVDCNLEEKILEKPACINYDCSTKKVRDIECCWPDRGCALDEYCTQDYKCEKKTPTKEDCPYECCENIEKYYNQPCPISKPHCGADNICHTDAECTTTEDCVKKYGEGYECKNGACIKGIDNKEECEKQDYNWVEEKTIVCGISCQILGTKPKITTKAYCDKGFDLSKYLPWIIIGVIVIVLLIVLMQPRKAQPTAAPAPQVTIVK